MQHVVGHSFDRVQFVETATERKTPSTEKYPNDAIYLPEEMQNELVHKENLTKAQAVKLINRASGLK